MDSSNTFKVAKWLLKIDEKEISEKIKEFTRPDFCYLCFAKLVHPTCAQSHYSSSRHQQKVSMWKEKEGMIKKYGRVVNLCPVCLVQVPPNVISHDRTKVHKKRAEQLEKLQSSKNENGCLQDRKSIQNQLYWTCDSWVDDIGLWDYASIGATAAASQIIALKDNNTCVICAKNIDTELEVYRGDNVHKSCLETFCSVCNLKTSSKQQLNEHKRGLKHRNNLAEKKAELNLRLEDVGDNLTIPRTIVTPLVKKGAKSKNSTVQNTITISERQNTFPALGNHTPQTPGQSSDVLSTVKHLIKQLDYRDLMHLSVALECRIGELKSKTKDAKIPLEYN